MKNIIQLLILSLIISCNRETPKIVYDDSSPELSQESPVLDQDIKKLVPDLPFSFDSLEYLYFPIGETDQSFKMNLRSFNSSYSSGTKSYSLGFLRGREINGNIDNLFIRPREESRFYYLTENEIKIKGLTYLYRIDTIHNIDRFVYRIIDFDSNKDGEINDDDVMCLYTSKTNGESFHRISPKFQQLIDFETWDEDGLLYFRTMEDIDKNGYFDHQDRINLFEYNLLKEDSIKLIFNQNMYFKN